MHGLGAALRQFLHFAKPWQRVALGLVLTLIGAFTGLYALSAVGIVLVAMPVVGWFRRRSGSAGESDESPHPVDL
jgi:uncharacterized membrane protein YphA (DoxX/SURF4 family)